MKFTCPHCQAVLSAKERSAGKKGTCAVCHASIMAPQHPSRSADSRGKSGPFYFSQAEAEAVPKITLQPPEKESEMSPVNNVPAPPPLPPEFTRSSQHKATPVPPPLPPEKLSLGHRPYLQFIGAIVLGCFLLFMFVSYQMNDYKAKQRIRAIKSIDVQHVHRIRLFEEKLTGYPGRKTLLKEFTAQEKQEFVSALGLLSAHRPNHPAYSVKWDVEMELTNGEMLHLRLLLDDNDQEFLHVENIGKKWNSILAVMKSQELYQFMADYSKNSAEVITSY